MPLEGRGDPSSAVKHCALTLIFGPSEGDAPRSRPPPFPIRWRAHGHAATDRGSRGAEYQADHHGVGQPSAYARSASPSSRERATIPRRSMNNTPKLKPGSDVLRAVRFRAEQQEEMREEAQQWTSSEPQAMHLVTRHEHAEAQMARSGLHDEMTQICREHAQHAAIAP